MDEFDAIMEKYGNRPLREHFESVDEINQFALQFYRDAAEIYDCFTRVKNRERNPSGYSLDDANSVSHREQRRVHSDLCL
jgi:hypothetical protein